MWRKRLRTYGQAGGLLILFMAPILLYSSWCWGWWGRGNPWLHYLLQCNCPAASEAARYPSSVEVLVSACRRPTGTSLSPSGRFMTVYVSAPQPAQLVIDFQTGASEELSLSQAFEFLTDNLVVQWAGVDVHLVDRTTGQQTPIVYLRPRRTPGGELADGTPDPDALLPLLQSASHVVVSRDTVWVLDGQLTPGAPPGHYRVIPSEWWPDPDRGWLAEPNDHAAVALRQFLDQHHIVYAVRSGLAEAARPSHSGEFYVQQDGIYLASTDQRLVENHQYPGRGYRSPHGWIYDDRGVVLSAGSYPLIEYYGFSFLSWQGAYVLQPVLLLKAPAVGE